MTQVKVETSRPTFVYAHTSWATVVMTEQDYRACYVEGQFDGEHGGIDFEAAALAGVKLFIFADVDALERQTWRSEFVVGTAEDFATLLKFGKYHWTDAGLRNLCNPLQNLLSPNGDCAICRVERAWFSRCFGKRAYTTRFPKEV